jgi:hypothetical protein
VHLACATRFKALRSYKWLHDADRCGCIWIGVDMTVVEFMDAHFWALWWLCVWVAACIANWGIKK